MILIVLCFIGAVFSLLNGELFAFFILLSDTLAAYLFYLHKSRIKHKKTNHQRSSYKKSTTSSRISIEKSKKEPASYFAGCITNDEVKSRYRELCKSLHPDVKNGDDTEFIKMHLEYDSLSKAI